MGNAVDSVTKDPWRAAAAIGTGGQSEISGAGAATAQGGPVSGVLKGAEGVWNTISGKNAEDAAKEAARLQAAGGDKALAENMRQFDISQQNLAPWLTAGRGALAEQQTLMGMGGDSAGALRALQSSPGYQQRLLQGQRGLAAGIGARGGMGSGKALTAGSIFNQDYASNEYGNRLNQLAGLAGTGQSTATTMGGLGANYAQQQGNIYTGVANAQGAAGMAGANARQSGLLGMLGAGATIYGAKR
jgi:hypothetical protein